MQSIKDSGERIFKYLSLIILLLSTISSAFALIDINTNGNQVAYTYKFLDTNKICQCTIFNDYFSIKNNGDIPLRIKLSNDKQLYMDESLLNLLPGQEKTIRISVPITCGDSHYTYKLFLDINGHKEVVKRTLKPVTCQSIYLFLQQLNYSTTPCTENQLQFTLFNPAPFMEQYRVIVEGKDLNLSFKDEVWLNPLEGKNYSLNIHPSCKVYGNKKILITVYSLHNDLVAKQVIPYNIERRYDYSIELTNETLCNYRYQRRFLIIKNNMYFPNTYIIKTKARITTNNVTIPAYGVATIPIDIPPIYKEGSYEIKIKVRSVYGGIEKTISHKYNVISCYSSSINIDRLVIADYDRFITAYINNTGALPANFSVRSNGQEVAIVFLNPNDAVSINIPVNYSEGKHKLLIESIPLIDGNVRIDRREFKIRVVNGRDAELPIVKPLTINLKSGSIKTLNISIINKGIYPSYFNILMNNSLLLLNPINENIYLYPRQGKQFTVTIDASFLKNNESMTETLPITIKTSNGFTYRYELRINAKKELGIILFINNAFKHSSNWVKSHKCYSLTILLIFLFIVLLITAIVLRKNKPMGQLRIMPFIIVTVIILLIAFITTFLLLSKNNITMPRVNQVNITDLHYTIPNNKLFTIDLNQYFYDPDKDVLSYELINKSPLLNAYINGSTLFIDEQRIGNYSFYVLANDNNGGRVMSNKFTVTIYEGLSFTDKALLFYKLNCWLVNLTFFLLILLELIIISSIILIKPRYKAEIL